MDSVVTDQLTTYFEEHPQTARAILDKAMTANRARAAAQKARDSIRRKTALGGAAMPDKLRTATSLTHPLRKSISWRATPQGARHSGSGFPIPGYFAPLG